MGHNVELATNGAGSYVDTFPVSDGTQTVERQVVVIGDESTYAARVRPINSDPAGTEYGLPIRRVCAGATVYHVVSAGSTNVANIKNAAGRVTGWAIFNNADYPVYVKFHNSTTTPTAGAGVVYTIGIQSGAHINFDDDDGIAFATGIGISITKLMADNDTTAVLASDCVVNVHYK